MGSIRSLRSSSASLSSPGPLPTLEPGGGWICGTPIAMEQAVVDLAAIIMLPFLAAVVVIAFFAWSRKGVWGRILLMATAVAGVALLVVNRLWRMQM